MFTVIFAIPRTSGWISQWMELIGDEEQKIARPRQIYTCRRDVDYTPIGEGYSLQELAVPEDWIGRSLVELEPRGKLGVQVVAVRDALTGELTIPPHPAARLKPSDSLLVAGRDDALATLSPREESRRARKPG